MKVTNIKKLTTINSQKGFSLLEIFIALSIGLVLFAGVLSIFVGMRTTTKETTSYGELQENGRFAISVLSDDLLRQDFWGDYSGTLDLASITPVPVAPGNECIGGGVNNGTFPLQTGHFRTLWGDTVTSSTNMGGCIDNAKVGTLANNDFSDVLQLKRVVANPATVFSVGTYYLTTNTNSGAVISGAPAAIDNAQSWEYQHHIYYIREDNQGSDKVPVLVQGRLVNSKIKFDPIIDGIELIRFMYGVDSDNDGIVNAFISADNMTDNYWNNANNTQILAVKIYVLARNVLPDNKYTNTNTYQIGDLSVTVDDNYRRLLFSSTVTLFNASVDSWTR